MSSTVTSESPSSPPNVSLQDLQNLLIVIDLATSRGAFRGNEISQIGALFDKLSLFLESVAPKPAENNTQPGAQPAQQMPPQVQQMPPQVQQMPPQVQQMPHPNPVMPMTPPFAPKIGI